MAALRDMYGILEEMLDCAKRDKLERVLELNRSFQELVPCVYQDPITELNLMYDNCRQSCVMAEKMRGMRQKFLEDATERFSKIPKPEED